MASAEMKADIIIIFKLSIEFQSNANKQHSKFIKIVLFSCTLMHDFSKRPQAELHGDQITGGHVFADVSIKKENVQKEIFKCHGAMSEIMTTNAEL